MHPTQQMLLFVVLQNNKQTHPQHNPTLTFSWLFISHFSLALLKLFSVTSYTTVLVPAGTPVPATAPAAAAAAAAAACSVGATSQTLLQPHM
jgi:hypothetical protein